MRTTRTTTRTTLVAVALLAVAAADAGAQQGTTRRPARRQQPIEIRGQVPTPQVVTVRPREVPAYNRRFLVPYFYDHDFWPAILPGYQLVSRRLVTGNMRLDSLTAGGADSARMADSSRMAAQARATLGIGLLQRPVPTGMAPGMMTPGDTTRRLMMPADTTRRTPTTGAPGGAAPTTPTTGGTPPASRPR
jgi:hypothetical protein